MPEQLICRICLTGGTLIALPCCCSGTVGYMHYHCYRMACRYRRSCDLCEMPLASEYNTVWFWLQMIHLVAYFGFVLVIWYQLLQIAIKPVNANYMPESIHFILKLIEAVIVILITVPLCAAAILPVHLVHYPLRWLMEDLGCCATPNDEEDG